MFESRLGRKKTFYIGLLILTLATVSLTFAPEFYSFVVIYFIIGLFSTGTMIAGYVIGMLLAHFICSFIHVFLIDFLKT